MAARALNLTSPWMRDRKGETYIRDLQEKLGFTGDDLDGVYGPMTAGKVAHRKYKLGWALSKFNNRVGVREYPILMGTRPVPAAMIARAKARREAAAAAAKLVPVDERGTDQMLRWVGLSERPANSNKVPTLAEFAKKAGLSSWMQAMGWPWCMFVAFLATYEAGKGSTGSVAGFKGKWNVLYTMDLLRIAEAGTFGFRIISRQLVRKGTVVLFDFPGGERTDHVGRALGPVGADGWFETVEGNTSSSNAGSQSNGGGVYRRRRHISQVRAFIKEAS